MAAADHFRPNQHYKLSKKRKRPDDDRHSLNKSFKKTKHYHVSVANLPNEMLFNIFSKMPHDTLLNASRVCLRWNQIATDPLLWSNIYFDERTPLASLYKWISMAPKLKHFSAKNRNEMDIILNKLSKRCKNLKSIELRNCCGTPLRVALHSLPLCNLVTRCRNLQDIRFHNLTFTSCKFFRLLLQNQLKNPNQNIYFHGPTTLKQKHFVTELEYYNQDSLMTVYNLLQ